MIDDFLAGLADNAESLVLIGALFAALIALFITLAAGLRLVEHMFPSVKRYLDARLGPDPVWEDQ